MISAAIGVTMPSRTVLSITCPEAASVALPGGRSGAITTTTMGVAIDAEHDPERSRFVGSGWARSSPLVSDHVEEAVHVADRLHRSAEAVEEAGRAGHEALPAVAPALPVRIMKVIGLVGLVERAGHLRRTGWGRLPATPWIGTMIPICGTAKVCEAASGAMFFTVFPLSCIVAADRPLDLGEERVAKAALAVEVEDGDPAPGSGPAPRRSWCASTDSPSRTR